LSTDVGEVLLYNKGKASKGKKKEGPKKSKLGWQRIVIWKLFKDLKGSISSQLRQKAVKLTGLAWR
jgi:hypothetical protein